MGRLQEVWAEGRVYELMGLGLRKRVKDFSASEALRKVGGDSSGLICSIV